MRRGKERGQDRGREEGIQTARCARGWRVCRTTWTKEIKPGSSGHPPLREHGHGCRLLWGDTQHFLGWPGACIHWEPEVAASWELGAAGAALEGASWPAGSLGARWAWCSPAPSPQELWFCARCGLGVSGSCPGLIGWGAQASGGGAVQGPALLGAFRPEGPVVPGETVGKAPRAILLEDGSIQPHLGLQRNCSSL